MLTKEDDDMADLHLSDGEWKLMKVLWQQSPRTLGALVAALAPTTGWSKATVFMMLKRLIAKGAVTLDESGKYQQYSAAVAYAEVEPEETASFLTKVYGGSVGLMVSNLVGRGALSEQEIRELKAILDEQKTEVSVWAEGLGTFVLNRSVNWFQVITGTLPSWTGRISSQLNCTASLGPQVMRTVSATARPLYAGRLKIASPRVLPGGGGMVPYM